MAVYGYVRVSSRDQNQAMQLIAFRRAGITNLVEEKRSAAMDRPEFERLLKRLNRGDTLVVWKLDRMARSVAGIARILETLKTRGIAFRSLTEALETETPQGRMFVQLLSVYGEFERELIRERCVAGQEAARAAGKTWGRKRKLTDAVVAQAVKAWRGGWYTQAVLADMLGVTVACMRDHIHRHERRGRWNEDLHR